MRSPVDQGPLTGAESATEGTPVSDFIAPFPWFGGKRKVTPIVWRYFGDVRNYVEPFFGSGAMLLGRPNWTEDAPWIETVNDKDGYVANFWRALQSEPDAVAHYADWPSNENDLHARHTWLRTQSATLVPRLEADPDFYDTKIAGWWVWGMAQWIGSGFCGDSGTGPWVTELDDAGVAVLVHRDTVDADGIKRQRVHLGNAGQGVSRQLVHLGDAGQGVSRQRVHLGNAGRGNAGTGECGLYAWMDALALRLKRVRVVCGDWARITGDTVTFKHGLTGVFLDPPYSFEAGRNNGLYAVEDGTVAHDVRRWALENGDNPLLRIALCGYDTEHDMPANWTAVPWKTSGGYGSQGSQGSLNASREVIWFSPHCLAQAKPLTLFDLEPA